jgi:predicted membrane protein
MRIRWFVLLISCLFASIQCPAQTSGFSYQGRLTALNKNVSGSFDLRFGLCSNQVDSAWIFVTNKAVNVTNGIFVTTIDFGFLPTNESQQWLDIAVRTNGVGSFSSLSPRQQITPAYSAFFAYNANNAFNFSGVISNTNLPSSVVTNGASNVNIQGTFVGNGRGLTNLVIPDGSLTLRAFGSLVYTNWTYLNSNATLASAMIYAPMKHVWTNNCLALTLTNGGLWTFFGLSTPFGNMNGTSTDNVYMSAMLYTESTNLGLMGVVNGTNSARVFKSDNIPAKQWTRVSGYYTGNHAYGNGLFFYVTTNGTAGQYVSGDLILSNIVIGTYTNYSPFNSTNVSNSSQIAYVNSTSELAGSNVQSAIDSLVYPWPASNVNVIVDGDSKSVQLYYNLMTNKWWKSTSYHLAGVQAVTLSFNTNAWATNTRSLLASSKTNLYILWSMHNDVTDNINTEITRLSNHLAQVASSNAYIIAVTTQPRAGYSADGINQYLFLRSVNNFLRTCPFVWRVVDAEAIMPENYNTTFYTDSTHNTPIGTTLVANEITRQVSSLRKTIPPALWVGLSGTNVTIAAPVSNGIPGLVAYGNTNLFHFVAAVSADSSFIAPSNTITSSSAKGIPGQLFWDGSFVYVCVATNTWRRAQLSEW